MTNPVKILFKKSHLDAVLPQYMTAGAAGADLYAVFDGLDHVVLRPLARTLISCGFSCEIPAGYEIQVRPRSGLALKQGLTVLNAPGTIDSDYRGEIGVMLVNLSDTAAVIKAGDRVAQMVVALAVQPVLDWTEAELSETARGAGGFGSTGVGYT